MRERGRGERGRGGNLRGERGMGGGGEKAK